MRTAALVAVALIGSAAYAARPTVSSQMEFKVGAHPTIIVDSSAGGVELTAGAAGAVRVEAERQADSEELARKLDVQVKQDGNTVRVSFNHKGMHWHENASVSFKITAPADATLEIATGGGGVSARGFSGGI
ncbi:MAG: hypothetical protein JWM53_1193, partial [bacterium]|nr:hypothetical protein [bacterium]